MSSDIILKPDKNRRDLESLLYRQLKYNIIPDSPLSVYESTWQNNIKPRVAFINPYQTRISKGLDVILEKIKTAKTSNKLGIEEAEKIKQALNRLGFDTLEEMKREGANLALLQLGTLLKKEGYEVLIIEAAIEDWDSDRIYFTTAEGSQMIRWGLPDKEIIKRIREFDPHIACVTGRYTHQYGNCREVLDLIKSSKKDIITIAGGSDASARPKDYLLDSPTDFVIRKEAYASLVHLCDFLTKKPEKRHNSIEEIDGTAYRKDGKVVINKDSHYIPKIDFLSNLDFSLVNLSSYNEDFHWAGPRKTNKKDGYVYTLQISVGCNGKCSFCVIPKESGPYRIPKEESRISTLKNYRENNIIEVVLEDANLFSDPVNTLSVYKTMENEKMINYADNISLYALIAMDESYSLGQLKKDIKFKTDSDSRRIFHRIIKAKEQGITTKQIIEQMAKGHCYGGYLAVESGDLEDLKYSKKPILNANQERTIKIVEMFAKNNIAITAGFMMGFYKDNETYQESIAKFNKLMDYGKRIKKAGAGMINLMVVTPLAKSDDFDSQIIYSTRNTDEGYSHELGTMKLPGLIKELMDLWRAKLWMECNGKASYIQNRKTGTWTVG